MKKFTNIIWNFFLCTGSVVCLVWIIIFFFLGTSTDFFHPTKQKKPIVLTERVDLAEKLKTSNQDMEYIADFAKAIIIAQRIEINNLKAENDGLRTIIMGDDKLKKLIDK